MRKKQIISNLLFCIMIASIVVAGFTVYACNKEKSYPFDESIVMAKHNNVDIKNVDAIYPNADGEITIDQLKTIPDNAMLGEISYGNESVQLIYNCNDVSMVEAATMLKNGDFLGEIGCAKIYGYRKNMTGLMQVSVGQNIRITTPYGEYEYKCVKKGNINSEWEATKQSVDAPRGLIVYTDRAEQYGFSGSYDMAAFEMVSGPKIIG